MTDKTNRSGHDVLPVEPLPDQDEDTRKALDVMARDGMVSAAEPVPVVQPSKGGSTMRYLVIAYDKTSVSVNRLEKGQIPPATLKVEDVLCQGSSFGDVVKSLEQAFGEEMKA